ASSATHFKCEPLVKVQVSSSKSCVGFCGGKSSFGCYCDSVCSKYGDCCPDYAVVCSVKK
ncbi:hypothetical protein HYY72_00170, partial [Candidatus Woesearchaeota archaeon]|nr:hypothetical protein [Candidatus Woesearchaeota archaeon]